MGYTHYWTFQQPKRGDAAKVEALYQKAVKDCAKIIRTYYEANGGLSGYTAHTPIGTYGGLLVNGKGDDAHEDFSLREHFKQNFATTFYREPGFNFCKTARKPYDVVVTACLIVLKHRLGDYIDVSSDGYQHDWEAGLELAKRVLKLKTLTIPETIDKNKTYELIKGGKL